MSHGMGGFCLGQTLVLLWTLSTLPTLGWIGLPARTGIAGLHEDAQARGGLPLPAMDGIFSFFAFPLPPVLIVPPSALGPPRADVPAVALPRAPTGGPPLR